MKKVAVITGGASGIGFAVSNYLKEKQYEVIVLDNNEQYIKSASEKGFVTHLCDLTESIEVRDTFDKISKKYDYINLLFNGVGWIKAGNFHDLTEEDWNKSYQLNFMTTIKCIRYAFPQLKNTSHSLIINLSSIFSTTNEDKTIVYSSIKAAINSFTKCLAKDFSKYGIRVNSILPGPVGTAFMSDFLSKVKSIPGGSDFLMGFSKNPSNRMGKPEDVAGLVEFLLSEQGNFMNGTCLPLDGGWSV